MAIRTAMPPFTMLSPRSCRILCCNHNAFQLDIDLADTAGLRHMSEQLHEQCNVHESHIGWSGSRSVYSICLFVDFPNTVAAGLYDTMATIT